MNKIARTAFAATLALGLIGLAQACAERPEKAEKPEKVEKVEKIEKVEEKKETPEPKEPAKAKPSELKKKMEKADARVKHLIAERDKIFAEMEKNPFHYSRTRNDRLKQLQVAIEEAEAEWYKLGESLNQN